MALASVDAPAPGSCFGTKLMGCGAGLVRPAKPEEAETWQRLKGSCSGRPRIKRLPPSKLLQAGSRRLYGFIPLTTYILGFITIVSAMTGYRAKMEPAYLQKNGATIPLNNNFKRTFPLTIQHWADFSVCNDKGVGTGKGFTSGIDLRPDTACAKAWLECECTLALHAIRDADISELRSKDSSGLPNPVGARCSS